MVGYFCLRWVTMDVSRTLGRYSDPVTVMTTDEQPVVPEGWSVSSHKPVPVVRCLYTWPEGHERHGERCKKWSIRGSVVCAKHGGNLPNVRQHAAAVVEAARMRLIGLADEAVDGIEDIMQNETSGAVRLKAFLEVLDRAGIRGGQELDVSIQRSEDPAEVLRNRLEHLRSRTIDGEVLNRVDVTVTQSADTEAEEHTDGEHTNGSLEP